MSDQIECLSFDEAMKSLEARKTQPVPPVEEYDYSFGVDETPLYTAEEPKPPEPTIHTEIVLSYLSPAVVLEGIKNFHLKFKFHPLNIVLDYGFLPDLAQKEWGSDLNNRLVMEGLWKVNSLLGLRLRWTDAMCVIEPSSSFDHTSDPVVRRPKGVICGALPRGSLDSNTALLVWEDMFGEKASSIPTPKKDPVPPPVLNLEAFKEIPHILLSRYD